MKIINRIVFGYNLIRGKIFGLIFFVVFILFYSAFFPLLMDTASIVWSSGYEPGKISHEVRETMGISDTYNDKNYTIFNIGVLKEFKFYSNYSGEILNLSAAESDAFLKSDELKYVSDDDGSYGRIIINKNGAIFRYSYKEEEQIGKFFIYSHNSDNRYYTVEKYNSTYHTPILKGVFYKSGDSSVKTFLEVIQIANSKYVDIFAYFEEFFKGQVNYGKYEFNYFGESFLCTDRSCSQINGR